MAYTSYFPAEWQTYYLYLVARGFNRYAPTTPKSYLIGLVGGGFPWEPLHDPETVARDARLVRALGGQEIVVFHLNEALKKHGPNFVREFVAAANAAGNDTITFARPPSLMLFGLLAADALYDARSLGGLFWGMVCLALALWERAARSAG